MIQIADGVFAGVQGLKFLSVHTNPTLSRMGSNSFQVTLTLNANPCPSPLP